MDTIPRPSVCPHGDCRSPDVRCERGEIQIDSADPGRRVAQPRDFTSGWVWICGACGRRLGLAPGPE